mmetsp:Transcript_16463/g.36850  ORF Transcript_16463/g.36850 Transcript_16463/m.36850 type:complete len:99 (-) Transcript_16463:481-777(-)
MFIDNLLDGGGIAFYGHAASLMSILTRSMFNMSGNAHMSKSAGVYVRRRMCWGLSLAMHPCSTEQQKPQPKVISVERDGSLLTAFPMRQMFNMSHVAS